MDNRHARAPYLLNCRKIELSCCPPGNLIPGYSVGRPALKNETTPAVVRYLGSRGARPALAGGGLPTMPQQLGAPLYGF
jgi:hypothetical protein